MSDPLLEAMKFYLEGKRLRRQCVVIAIAGILVCAVAILGAFFILDRGGR